MKIIKNEEQADLKDIVDDLKYLIDSVELRKEIISITPIIDISPIMQGLRMVSKSFGRGVNNKSFIIIDESPFLPNELPKVHFYYANT